MLVSDDFSFSVAHLTEFILNRIVTERWLLPYYFVRSESLTYPKLLLLFMLVFVFIICNMYMKNDGSVQCVRLIVSYYLALIVCARVR